MHIGLPSRLLLVTGASGFLGSEICRCAHAEGWRVRALVRREDAGIDGAEETFVGDISDAALMRSACEGSSAVVHTAGLAHVFGSAANDSDRFTAVNVAGTFNVVNAAVESGVTQIVLASSVSVYGDCSAQQCNELAIPQPRDAYAVSKWRAEVKAIEAVMNAPASLAILRFATIYGEGDRGNVAKLIGALRKKTFICPGSGQNQKSLIYKEDAARACLRVLASPMPGTNIFNVSGRAVRMQEIMSAACAALGRAYPRVVIPTALLKLGASVLQGLGDPGHIGRNLDKFLRDDIYSATKFETAYQFHSQISLSEGIRREVISLVSSAAADG